MTVLSHGVNLDRRDISLGSLVLNRVENNGDRWIVEDLDGWWTLPDPQMFDQPRSIYDDGSYDVDGRYGPRLITLRGRIYPGSVANLATLRDQLLQAVNLVRQGATLVVNEAIPKQANVRLNGRPKIDTNSIIGQTIFEIPLKASDPRKYGTSLVSGSVGLGTPDTGRTYNLTFNRSYGASGATNIVTLVNSGWYSSPLTVRFDGPVQTPGIEQIATGKTMFFNITLAPGEYLLVDATSMVALLNGTQNRRYTMQSGGQPMSLEVGSNQFRFFGVQQVGGPPNPLMTVSGRSAWM